jgi:hypothetical protein
VNTAKNLVNCTNDSCTDDEYSETPLIIAARPGHVEVLRFLLKGGINVDIAGDNRRTAIRYTLYSLLWTSGCVPSVAELGSEGGSNGRVERHSAA